MPAEVKLRQRDSARGDPTANIPTTIKNPERVAHRRTELIEVATKLFLERGFHNTSIRDIVRACSFNIASLYMYVSSKEDILYLVALDLMNNIARELGETKLDPNSARKSLADGFASYCRICDRLRRPIRLLYREVGVSAGRASLERPAHRRRRGVVLRTHRPTRASKAESSAISTRAWRHSIS